MAVFKSLSQQVGMMYVHMSKLPGEWIFCRVPITYDMHQKNLFLATSIFRSQAWTFESKF